MGPPSLRPERSSEPFSTHIPALIAVGRHHAVRRVLELGCGPHSTGLFLDRRCFPGVEKLVSIENDPEWHRKILQQFPDEGRLELRLVPSTITTGVVSLDISSFDLIFIDDSKTGAERVRSIEHVLPGIAAHAVALVHDFEFQPYREAVNRWLPPTHTVVELDAFNPSSGLIVSRGGPMHAAAKKIRHKLRMGGSRISPSDADAWLNFIGKKL